MIKDVRQLSLKPEEMDWVESFKCNQEAIELVYGVNSILAGRVEGANRASALVADQNFCTNRANPLIRLISMELNYRVPVLYNDPNLVVFVEEAHSEDPDTKRADAELLLKSGAMTRNELRATMGKPPLPPDVGDVLIVPVSMLTEPVHTQSSRDEAANESAIDEDVEDNKRARRTRRKAMVSNWLKVHERLEKEFARDMKAYFGQQAEHIARNVESGAGVPFDPSTWDEPLRKVAFKHLVRCASAGAQMELAKHEKAVDTHIDLPDALLQRISSGLSDTLAQPYWSAVNRDTQKLLQRAMEESLTQGMTLREQVAHIRDYLGERSADSRAVNTARTETTGSLNLGANAAIEDLARDGLVSSKSWLATVDDDTRDAHEEANGQTVPVHSNFTVGGELCPYPGYHGLSARNRCRCRCALVSE